MWKAIAAAGLLALGLGSLPAAERTALDVPTTTPEVQLYGLPIFTSDGVEIGVVADTGPDVCFVGLFSGSAFGGRNVSNGSWLRENATGWCLAGGPVPPHRA